MALDKDNALAKARNLLESSYSSRALYETYCGLCFLYAYGPQYGFVNAGRSGGRRLQTLPTVSDINSTSIRLAMNIIRPRITKINSRLKPKDMLYHVRPASTQQNDLTAALVAEESLNVDMAQIGALGKLRRASLWRCVLGSVIMRRTMAAVTQVAQRYADGQPVMRQDGQPLMLPMYEHDLAVCPPYEFIRDPAANSPDFAGEECIGHEKAMPLSAVKRYFGSVPGVASMQTRATMGQLLEFQNYLRSATGYSMGSSGSDSKEPAVMVSEWWFRDDERDAKRRWPWYMMCVRDTSAQTLEEQAMLTVWFSRNPFHRLPLHHFLYEEEANSPWGRGIPSILLNAQDAFNASYNSMLRRMVFSGTGKWLYQAGSVDAAKLNNAINVPVEYRNSKPELITGVPLDSASIEINRAMPNWLDSMLNMSPVQSGQAVARGEAARAYEIRRDAADTPLNAINDDDETTLSELLTGYLFDSVKTADVQSLRAKLSDAFTDDQIMALKMQDAEQSISGVKIVPGTLRPQTPDEMKQDASLAIQSKMLDPDTARRALIVKGRIGLNPKEEAAYRKQILEMSALLQGEPIGVEPEEDHDMHIWTIGYLIEQPQWSTYTQEQKGWVRQHAQAHREAQVMARRLNSPAPEQPMEPTTGQPDENGGSPDNIIPFPQAQAVAPEMAMQAQL
ncbi:MAG: hypothetical protein ABIH03_11520 [Pseudomonadota bacterium]